FEGRGFIPAVRARRQDVYLSRHDAPRPSWGQGTRRDQREMPTTNAGDLKVAATKDMSKRRVEFTTRMRAHC
ncbi:MAG: hypothetical protein WBP79_07100, partial [Candidatus Acidiferrales bacterium]